MGNLKKQSQFAPGQNDITSYEKGDYDIIPPCGAHKNKAKQSQLAGLWPEIRSTKLGIRNKLKGYF
jgi:hypothetical protein